MSLRIQWLGFHPSIAVGGGGNTRDLISGQGTKSPQSKTEGKKSFKMTQINLFTK